MAREQNKRVRKRQETVRQAGVLSRQTDLRESDVAAIRQRGDDESSGISDVLVTETQKKPEREEKSWSRAEEGEGQAAGDGRQSVGVIQGRGYESFRSFPSIHLLSHATLYLSVCVI